MVLFVFTVALVRNSVEPYAIDFASYWAAAVLALDGNPAGAYNFAVHGAVQNGVVKIAGGMPFAYPPPFLILLLPFGFFPYALAAALWTVTTFALYVAAAKRLLPGAGWAIAATGTRSSGSAARTAGESRIMRAIDVDPSKQPCREFRPQIRA